MKRSSRALFAMGAVGCVVASCVSAPPLQKLCDPGTFVFCRCPDGEEGSRQCDDSGDSFMACQLQTGGPCPMGTTSSTGGTSASTSSGGGTTSSSATTSSATASTTGATTSVSATTSASTGAGAGTLFFSEYVEGSSFNKALEVVNRGTTSVSLQGCGIVYYFNGSTVPSMAIPLSPVMLDGGKVFVICHSSFSQPALCNQLDGKILQTGNDVVELQCNGMPSDILGTIGQNAVWGTAPTTTQGATLRRKCSVTTGDTNGSDPFDPATEWDGFPIDTLSDLGQYNCP